MSNNTNWLPRFVLLTFIWGASFLFIKLGLESLAPLQVALARMVFGVLILLALLRLRGELLPRGWGRWGHLSLAAVFLNAIPFTLFAYAEQRVPSAIASICNATAPLFTLVVAMLALPDEGATRERTLGLSLGFGGVLLLLGVWRGVGGGYDSLGIALALGAAASYGVGVRRYLSNSGHSSLALSAGQLLAGTVQLALITPVVTQLPAHVSLRSALAVGALGLFGTGIAHVLRYGIIRDAGATVGSTVGYFLPIVSVGLGVLLLGEHLTWNVPAGALVILAGAMVTRLQPGRLARVYARS